MPYINASIILQLLATTFPGLKKLQREEGPQVRRLRCPCSAPADHLWEALSHLCDCHMHATMTVALTPLPIALARKIQRAVVWVTSSCYKHNVLCRITKLSSFVQVKLAAHQMLLAEYQSMSVTLQGRARFQLYQKLLALAAAVIQAVGQLTYIRPFVADWDATWLAVNSLTLVAGAMILVHVRAQKLTKTAVLDGSASVTDAVRVPLECG